MKTFDVIPSNFDGSKFAQRYSLSIFDFYVVNNESGSVLHAPDSVPDNPVLEPPDLASTSVRLVAIDGTVEISHFDENGFLKRS